ncbi:nucleic acid/nucleotide deaminase domain-containing protein [Streptomyces sp. NBC_01465]|uniref:nucleic acid/nucleotide deaminase domain-containing protein n=1 Tax=Streptomyces sp. NBC_01465 TaxID=2903878 RepID=UPI002E343009|nr:nucleic acid/nucleotide deaminase domain-containing protein [Streptomyces sp. NBC_01465]
MTDNTPQDDERAIAGIQVPFRAGPYFSTRTDDPATLGAYAESVGRQVVREECEGWLRLGSDGGYELCVDPNNTVKAVLLDFEETDRFVNSSPEAFRYGLLELRRTLEAILSTDDPQTASRAFDRLSESLRAQDPGAFGDREDWWPLVLDDIRDTASAPNYAAFEYIGPDGTKQILTQSGAIGEHPEERLWSTLHAAGVPADRVQRIHTDLQPCFLPGHYCSLWLAEIFPDAQMTHTFPYGETAASRAEGIRRLNESAVQGS